MLVSVAVFEGVAVAVGVSVKVGVAGGVSVAVGGTGVKVNVGGSGVLVGLGVGVGCSSNPDKEQAMDVRQSKPIGMSRTDFLGILPLLS